LKTNITCYVVTKYSDVTVFVEGVSCRSAFVLYLALSSVELSVLLSTLQYCYTQWRLVVKLAGRAAKFHLWLNIWDCRPGCFY